jgi:hypothetical protein
MRGSPSPAKERLAVLRGIHLILDDQLPVRIQMPVQARPEPTEKPREEQSRLLLFDLLDRLLDRRDEARRIRRLAPIDSGLFDYNRLENR